MRGGAGKVRKISGLYTKVYISAKNSQKSTSAKNVKVISDIVPSFSVHFAALAFGAAASASPPFKRPDLVLPYFSTFLRAKRPF
jgi:hypothetical protein